MRVSASIFVFKKTIFAGDCRQRPFRFCEIVFGGRPKGKPGRKQKVDEYSGLKFLNISRLRSITVFPKNKIK